MKSFYDKNKKTIWTVGGIAVSIITLAFLLPKKDTTGSDGTGGVSEGNTGGTQNGGNSFDAGNVANQLYAVMSDVWWLRSSDILKIFSDRVPRTNSAFVSLYSAFGKRQYNKATGGTSFGADRDLIEWLKAELSSDHYETLKSFYPNQSWL